MLSQIGDSHSVTKGWLFVEMCYLASEVGFGGCRNYLSTKQHKR